MLRKVFKTGNSLVISLPNFPLNCVTRKIVISPVEEPLAVVGIDESFAQQVAEFIACYRSVLEALAEPC